MLRREPRERQRLLQNFNTHLPRARQNARARRPSVDPRRRVTPLDVEPRGARPCDRRVLGWEKGRAAPK